MELLVATWSVRLALLAALAVGGISISAGSPVLDAVERIGGVALRELDVPIEITGLFLCPLFDLPGADPAGHLVDVQLARIAQKTGKAAVALMPVPDSQVGLYGVAGGTAVEGGHIEVDRIVEKPPPGKAPSNLAVIGRYVLPPDVFDVLARLRPGAGGEIQLTDGLAVLVQQKPLLGVRFTGTRYDAGDRLLYLQSNIAEGSP